MAMFHYHDRDRWSQGPAPIELLEVAGSSTGNLFPTGSTLNRVQDIEVTGMDVVANGDSSCTDFGLRNETREELGREQKEF